MATQQDLPLMSSSKRFKGDLPIKSIRFAKYSHFPTNLYHQHESKRRNIIVGSDDFHGDDDEFYEMIVNDNNNNNKENLIIFKSFVTDYNKKMANVKYIGLKNIWCAHSYLVRNNKYIIVFRSRYGDMENNCYNVYDMEKDRWLLKKDEIKLKNTKDECIDNSCRSILINDEILIVSNYEKIYFYCIAGDHITKPKLIYKYYLQSEDVYYRWHGMSVISFIKQEKQDQPQFSLYQTYKLKILLFGGQLNKDILSSFVECDILISYSTKNKEDDCSLFTLVDISINDKLIDKQLFDVSSNKNNKLQYYNDDDYELRHTWFDFGYQRICNGKNETIIVIIGGYEKIEEFDKEVEMQQTRIHLYNCVTHELIRKNQV